MVTNLPVAYIALGANLPSVEHGTVQATLQAALREIAGQGVSIRRCSSWWRSEPQPPSEQPDFINAVAEVSTSLTAEELLALLHRIEADFGRRRQQRWEARVLDLDLIDFGHEVREPGLTGALVLPHPRMHERLFVLLPLREIAPAWRHPISNLSVDALISKAKPLKIKRND